MNRIRLGVSLAVVLLASTPGCSDSKPDTAGDAPNPDAPPAQSAKADESAQPAQPAKADESDLLKCGDVISKVDLKSLGMGDARFDPELRQRKAGQGVICNLGELGHAGGNALMVLFQGSAYSSMKSGAERGVEKGRLKTFDGPVVGVDSIWTEMVGQKTITFRGKSARFSATIAGADPELVAKVALLVAGNMDSN